MPLAACILSPPLPRTRSVVQFNKVVPNHQPIPERSPCSLEPVECPRTLLEPGARLGKYEVLAHVATGGMGNVYKALDLELRRTVALKVLPPHLAQLGPVLERFKREARSAARLSHPHIVTLFECGHDADRDLYYLALEYIDGIDLGAYIERKGPLPPEKVRRILFQAAKALDHAFEQGVIHRDIKPANFLMAREGGQVIIKLTDLGLARIENDNDFKVTRDGFTVGTVDYLSPEQARDSQSADIRSDIYSLGCTAYHMLAGRPPFAEGGLGERIYKHQEVPPPDVRQFNPAVAPAFWAILEKMLAKEPQDRYATPGELLGDLLRTPAEVSDTKTASPAQPPDPGKIRKTDHVPSPSAPTPPAEAAIPPQMASPTSVSDPTPIADPTPMPESANVTGWQITPEQVRAAASFFERAAQVLAEGGGTDYARQLLTNSLKLNPFDATYRLALRELNRKASGSMLGRWLGSLNVLALKSKMRAARSNGDWRKVLELGEDVLARQPADADTHIEMAGAVEELGLSDLSMWFLDHGLEVAPDSADLLRARARLHEDRKEWKRAIALWEKVRKLAPDDYEAQQQINKLSVKDHIGLGPAIG